MLTRVTLFSSLVVAILAAPLVAQRPDPLLPARRRPQHRRLREPGVRRSERHPWTEPLPHEPRHHAAAAARLAPGAAPAALQRLDPGELFRGPEPPRRPAFRARRRRPPARGRRADRLPD